VLWLRIVAWSFERSVVGAHMSTTAVDLVGVNATPIAGALAAALAGVPGVDTVIGNRVVDWQHAGGPIAIDAYDAPYFDTLAPRHARLIGTHDPGVWRRRVAGEAVLVSSNFAHNLARTTGDVLTLETPTGPLALPIAGVVSHLCSPRGTVVISRVVYERHWRDGAVSRLFAELAEGADVAAVRAAAARHLGGRYDLQIFSGEALVGYFATQVRRAFAGVDLLAALMLAVVLVAVGETLGAAVVERTWELGALRAIGARRRVLQRMVVVEAVLLSVLGLALASVMGLGLGAFWVGTTFTHLLGWGLEWHSPWAWAGMMGLLTMAGCTLGAWLPARRIAGLEPAAALREE
jgi:putative ABC transport system permease protein